MEFKGTIIDRQRELEMEMLDLGTSLYRRTISSNREHGREHISNYGLVLTTHAIRPLELAIKKFIAPSDNPNGSGSCAGGVTKKWFREAKVPADTLALIAINTVMDAITASELPRVQALTTRIAKRIQSEMKLTAYKKTHPRLFNYAFKNALSQAKQGTWLESYMLESLYNSDSDTGDPVTYPIWDVKTRHKIGAQLLNLLIQTTGLVAIRTITKKGKSGSGKPMSRAVVEATPESKSFINAVIQRTEQLSTYRLPCIIPPRSWSGDIESSGGGYWFLPDDTLTFMKSNRGCPYESLDGYYTEHLTESEGSANLLTLANRLQNVPYSVNRFVLETALTERGIYEPIPLPTKSDYISPLPNDGVGEAADMARTHNKGVAAQAAMTHIANRSNMGKHMLHSRSVATASRFKDESAIYFPHIADFRGRVYSVGSHLNRMGNDLQRGLLKFSRGKEVTSGSIGERMLMIEASNAFGLDKVSYDERVSFIDDNRHRLDDLIPTAENKYQFMAVAEELDRLVIHGRIDSHVVCNRDATCSGLQHFSAMLKDPDGGRSVNIAGTRGDNQPDSIYIDVATRLTRKIEHMLTDGQLAGDTDKKWATDWLKIGIDKSITKRPVMTLVYGLTKHSSRVYVEEALKECFENDTKERPNGWKDKRDLFHPTLWLNQLLWEAIQEQLVGACEAMKYLRDAVTHYVLVENPKTPQVIWTTPYDSLPILSDYRVVKSEHVVRTVIGEKSIKLALNPQRGRLKDRVAFESTVNAIAANYVHSCDAALLRALCLELEEYPDINISCIHDSVGVHAVDVPVMEEAIRQAFIQLYPSGSNPLQLFGNQMGYKERPAPELGNLNLEEGVLTSDYFFS